MAAFWKTSHYRAWFAADTASALGFVLRDLALSMVAYDISGSVALAGWLVTLVTLAGKVSQIFGGTFVDRHDRRTLILVNAAVGVVIWGTAGALLMGGVLTFPILTALAVLAAAVGGFLGEATDAMLRSIIDIAEFQKVNLRVAQVIACEPVPKADKLLQFKIADGLENRTIVSGIAQHYKPEELVGRQVCFIANLPPRKLKGIVSEGMILSAENFDGSLSVIGPMREVKPGSEVK